MGSSSVLALAQVGSGLAQGITSYTTGQAQGNQLESEGIILEGEANREASRIEDEGNRFAQEQKMAYIASGVEIGGSAVVTLAQTDKWAKTQADAVRSRGSAIRSYYNRRGQIAKNEGLAGFISGIAGGISKGYAAVYDKTRGVKTGSTGGTSTSSYATRQNARAANVRSSQIGRFKP